MTLPVRLPPDAAALGMVGLDELAWPFTVRYIVHTPWGTTQQLATFNVPALEGNTARSYKLAWLLWGMFTAPAVTGDVRCPTLLPWFWKSGAPSFPEPLPELKGNRIAAVSPREQTPHLVLLTGHNDDDGRRRLPMPGAPSGWASEGLLTTEGFEELIPHAIGCMMGLATPGLGSGIEWLIAYPGRLAPTLGNPDGVAFRRVTHVRVPWHTARAPDVSGIGWG